MRKVNRFTLCMKGAGVIVIVMGVCGCGKSTLAAAIAASKGWLFLDADDFHPPANRAKMQSGTPLDDSDRAGWLDTLAGELAKQRAAGRSVVLACSALKQAYRDRLAQAVPFRLIHLTGDRATLAARLASRQGHFMNPALLDSQLATLEPPAGALSLSVDLPPEAALAEALAALDGPDIKD